MKIWVLKLSPRYDLSGMNDKRIAQLADGDWKVNLNSLKMVDYVIVMHEQKVVFDYVLNDTIQLNLKKDFRVSNLGLKNANNATGLVGEFLDYRTANPSTIKDLDDLQKLIK
ncbi:hypothetical protein P7I10_14475 [Lactococcus lactis]|uniref:hypothetical protein n=1 Tax=Lactococcus lactis TaxID=1358 RepID=UPI00288F6B27|nr:hypothetical protein [Lactococcus lactis]MDT2869178.1 hypothetical protein [Lactococcus lactis]MDT2950109.1 hypothetical protein [Lactococcus lactis]